jgi:hypothetical protein
VRRETLASLLRKDGDGIRLSEHIDGTDGAAVFRHACALGAEASSRSGATGPIGQDARPIG